ncbi:hypothetical protein KDH83_28465, partial [Achromobacter sp. Marseille-Q0513]|uniref:DUF6603 domain-containing protein n=1 Tax=Achromobacter sp. Marseille-Q0513 TaxID=2829161 RepID=UPI001BA31132
RTVLLAQYQAHDGAGEIDVKKLLASVVPDVAAGLPDGLVIDLADAMIAIVSENGQRKFLFAMDIALEFPLSSLPLIGKAVPQDAKAGLKNLKLIVSSAALSADDVTLINSLSPKPVLPEPAAQLKGDAVPKGFSMAAQIELGQFTMLLTSPPAPANTKGLARAHAPYASPAPSSVTWVNVQKSFGPVSIQKVGFAYDQGSLYVLSNLSLAAGGLEIDLIGIGMGSPIKQPRLGFTIEGLAISYQQGPVSIMGGMLGTLDPLDFTGALSVKVPQFSLAALAGYAQYQDHPSFFLYGVLNAPLGGPPAFFVNGVAAGVGFNRKLLVPDVSGVASFPLVQWAQGDGTPSMDPSKPIGDQVQAVLTMLSQSGVVAPSVGDYWLAAGLRFTSFELVDSFALLTVSVGADVEIDLLGLSTVTVPPQDPVPVAEVQIALEVSFSYARGLVAVAGQLTDNSYVLSRDCKLTGGFAFYVWFKGERAGEAVLSLGGYNPNFTVPKDYPVVPRLGLNWQVIPELSITGGLYFAVTPNVIMAGGKLSAVWDSGPIRAWFTYWADFLMTFKPFHYHVNGGIDLGASFTVDLWLFSISVTIHIGVELTLKGPPFSGQARVDLSIISFTISFGDAGQGDTKIPWSQFVQQLLPSNAPPAMARRTRRGRLEGAASAPRADDVQPAVVQINLTGGLVRRLPDTADGPCYLVSAETFQCSVLTTIPAKSVAFDTNPDHAGFANLGWAPDAQQPCDPSGKPIPVNNSFGVGPARIASGSFNPALTLSLESEEDSTLQAVRMLSNAPKALWEVKQLDANGVPQVDPGTALTDASFANALVGLSLSPCVAPPDTLCPVPLESLLYTLDDDIRPFAWSPGQPPAGDDFSGQTVAGTIASAPAARQRGLLLAALAPLGVNVDTQVNGARLATPATNDLESAPRLRLLGEQAAA